MSDFESLRSLVHSKTPPQCADQVAPPAKPARPEKTVPEMEAQNGKTTAIEQVAPVRASHDGVLLSSSPIEHAAPKVAGMTTPDEIEDGSRGWFAYIKTKHFWIVLLLGSVSPETRPLC